MSDEFAPNLGRAIGRLDVSSPPSVDRLVTAAVKRRRSQRSWLVAAAAVAALTLLALVSSLRGRAGAVSSAATQAAPAPLVERETVSFVDVLPRLISDVALRFGLLVVAVVLAALGVGWLRRQRVSRPVPTWATALLWTLGLLIVVVAGVRLSVQMYFAASPSMEPAIAQSSRMVVASHDTDVRVGDVIVHRGPQLADFDRVARVIAAGGDTVQAIGGELLVNGTPSTSVWIDPELPIRDFGPVQVAPNEFFVIGDNYRNSLDSRTEGTVPQADIRGTVRWATNGWSG